MRNMLFILVVILCAMNIQAQKVFSVRYISQTDIKVFVEKYESMAGLVVYKVDYENRAGVNNGQFCFPLGFLSKGNHGRIH